MAIGTPVSLGSKKTGTALSTTITLSTSSAVASGETIFLFATGATALSATVSASGGGLTWSKDFEVRLGSFNFGVFSAPAPAGLAKETTLTATFSIISEACYIFAAKDTGVGAAHKTASKSVAGSGKPWEAGEFTTTKANTLILAFEVDDAESSIPGAGYTELDDVFDTPTQANYTVIYSVKTSTGTFKPGGELNKAGTVRLGVATAWESGTTTPEGKASIPATGSFAAQGSRTTFAKASVAGTGSLSAKATRIAPGAAKISATSSMAAAGVRTTASKAAIAGTSSVAATGLRVATGSAAMSGSGVLQASGRRETFGKPSIAGTGALSASGTVIHEGEEEKTKGAGSSYPLSRDRPIKQPYE